MEVKVADETDIGHNSTIATLMPATISFMGGAQIRTVGSIDDPWFNGNDLASFLKYANTQDAIRKHVDPADRSSLSTVLSGCVLAAPGNFTLNELSSTYVNEFGVYSLAFGSKLPAAKAFKRWVISDLLPNLRKTGEYKIKGHLQIIQNELASQRLLTDKSIQEAIEQKRIAEKQKLLADAAKEREVVMQFQREKEQKEHEEALAKKDEELKQSQETAKKNKESTDKWVEASIDTALVPKTHIMYIASNKYLMSKKKFKVGGDENIKNCMKRIQGYCTMHQADDPIYIVAMYQCHDYRAVEHLFWITGDRYRDKQGSEKEMIWLELPYIQEILDSAIHAIDQSVASHVSRYVEFKRATVEDQPKNYEPLDLSNILTHKPKISKKPVKIDAAQFTAVEMDAVIIEKINEYARTTDADYDFSAHKNQRDLKIYWKLFIPKFDNYEGKSRMEWRTAAKLLCDGMKVIFNFRDT